MLIRWKHPTTKDDKGNVTLTHEEKWSSDDDKLANYNSKALTSIFNGVGANQIKLITICESAKEAWEILQTAYVGTSDVKRSKLLILTIRFEELRMKDYETLGYFYSRLCDIASESFTLGERILESNLCEKLLGIFLPSFNKRLLPLKRVRILTP